MLSLIDSLIGSPWYDYVDLGALLLVCAISNRRKDVISLVVLLEFALVYFGQNWFRGLTMWGSLGLDYQYSLGIKDTVMAVNLLFLAASPWLVAAYIVPALTCWLLWASYSLVEYERFLTFYYAWSPIYALGMFLQIYGLSIGDSDAGKRIRATLVPHRWHWVFQSVNRLADSRIALPYSKTQRAYR